MKESRTVKNRGKVTSKFDNDVDHILSEASPFVIKEAYRTLRTNIIFSLPGTDPKCIAVTSPARSEGKSTNAINIAIAFSQIGKRTLLIDCDLRRPTVAARLRLAKQPGLSNLIVGESDVNQVLQHHSENFDVIAAGQIPRDATGLLASKRMKYLLGKLKEYYDYVIIDLPPITTVTDAAILTQIVDGYLLVVRHDATEYRGVSAMLHQLQLSEAKILGFLFTNAPVIEKKYYSHYYA